MADIWRALRQSGQNAGLKGDEVAEYLRITTEVFNEKVASGTTFDTYSEDFIKYFNNKVILDDRVVRFLHENDVELFQIEHIEANESTGYIDVEIATISTNNEKSLHGSEHSDEQPIAALFANNLEKAYYVETNLVDVLDDLANDASDDQLAKNFSEHREETRNHVRNLEAIFRELNHEPETRQSMVLDAIIEEREQFRMETTDERLRDVYDLHIGIKNERIEITIYEGLLTLSDKIGYSHNITDPLEDNLSSERRVLRRLEALMKSSRFETIFGHLLR